MTPAEIAAKLTPQRVAMLRAWNPPPDSLIDRLALCITNEMAWAEQNGMVGRFGVSDLGRAVLAALDAKEST